MSWCRAIVLLERGDSVAGERDLDGDERIVAERLHGLQVAGDAGIGLAVDQIKRLASQFCRVSKHLERFSAAGARGLGSPVVAGRPSYAQS